MDGFAAKVAEDPYARFLGITVNEARPGYAACSLKITADMFNFLGVVHGGLIFTLADVAFSVAGNCGHPPSFALDVSGSFLKTARIGDVISARAQLLHTTKRTGVYRMEVFNGEELIATFNGTVFRKTGPIATLGQASPEPSRTDEAP